MKKIVVSLSFIIALRFFGLFLVMPLLSVYAHAKTGSNDFLIGLTVGSYAISQLLFQLPFSLAGDRFGRKIPTVVGLVIFGVGSLVCAFSDDALMLLFGRLMQGSGAISSVVTAMVADFTGEEKRSKAMAIVGGSIAMSFVAAMLIGPYVGGHYGVDKLFLVTAVLAVLSIVFILFFVPNPPKLHHISEKPKFSELFQDKNLIKMYVNMFLHGFLLTVAFMIIPLELKKNFGWAESELWEFYIPSVLIGVVFMVAAAILGEKYGKIKQVFLLSIALNAMAFLVFGLAKNDTFFVIGGVLFFIGFNMLEPLLQSTVTKFAKASQRSSALGVFTSSQYLGTFLGGVFAGAVLHLFDVHVLGVLLALMSVLWLFYMQGFENPPMASFVYLPLEAIDKDAANEAKLIRGVLDVYANMTEKLLVVKFDKTITDSEYIRGFFKYVEPQGNGSDAEF